MDDFAKELNDFLKDLGPAQAAAQESEEGKKFDREALERMAQPLQDFQMMAKFGYPLVVPPLSPLPTHGPVAKRRHIVAGLGAAGRDPSGGTGFRGHDDRLSSEQAGGVQPGVWTNTKAGSSRQFAKEVRKGGAEFYYNDVQAFLHAIIIYVVAFLLAGAGVLCLSRDARPFGVASSLRLLPGHPGWNRAHVWAGFSDGARRPAAGYQPVFVRNFYRLGDDDPGLDHRTDLPRRHWGAGRLSRWLCNLLIAQNLAIGGDTMEMLRAVLDTNFWLATHVVVITLGYASTFFAGLLAILFNRAWSVHTVTDAESWTARLKPRWLRAALSG